MSFLLDRFKFHAVFIVLIILELVSCSRKKDFHLPPPENTQEKTNKREKGQIAPETASSSHTNALSPIAAAPIEKQVLPKHLENLKRMPATVLATGTTSLSFRVSGTLKHVYVTNGSQVKKGQPIASLADDIFLQQKQLAQIALERQKNNAWLFDRALNRTRMLDEGEATTRAAVEQAEIQQRNAHINVKEAEAQLALAQINLKETVLRAPFDGYIFGMTVWEGTFVQTGSTIAFLTSPGNLQIQMNVPQTIRDRFQLEKIFTFHSASGKTQGELRITGIIPYIDPTTNTYPVIGKPQNVKGNLMAGETVFVDE